jgi:L-threonylcarbamoyladenylate synthase
MPSTVLPVDHGSIAIAAGIVRRGGLVVYPTDTVYGLGCNPFDNGAVERLFRVKGRGSKPVTVLCSSIDTAGELVELNQKALDLAKANWPGALTIVSPLRRRVPRLLNQGGSDLGVRVPAHRGCLELIGACGGWLTGTSANVSGEPPSRSAMEASNQLGNAVDLILDGGRLEGKESTVVRIDRGEVTILRTGPVGVGTR